jgi:hypothetical protein
MADEPDNGAPVGWVMTPATKQELDDWVPTEPDNWVAIEYVREVLDDVRNRLMAGADGPGATLTADECVKVLGCMKNPQWPNSRPPKNPLDAVSMAGYCRKLEKGGMSMKSALDETMKHFGCKRSTLYAALKAYFPSK